MFDNALPVGQFLLYKYVSSHLPSAGKDESRSGTIASAIPRWASLCHVDQKRRQNETMQDTRTTTREPCRARPAACFHMGQIPIQII